MSENNTSAPGRAVPLYAVAVKVSGVDVQVRVNDVPVFAVDGGHVETEFDVNPHVVTGMNHLGVLLRPPPTMAEYPEGARAEITLRVEPPPGQPVAEAVTEQGGTLVFEAGDLQAPRPEPDTIDTTAAEPGEAIPQQPELDTGPSDDDWARAFAGSRTPLGVDPVVAAQGLGANARIAVNLLTPFSPWSWLSADTLPQDQETFDAVMGETFRLWGLIKTKKIDDLDALAAAQADDWVEAYGLPGVDEAKKMLGIAATLGDPEVKPQPFPDPGSLRLQVVGFGKLAHLLASDGKGPITLGVKGMPHMTGRFVALFCRHGDTWTMIR